MNQTQALDKLKITATHYHIGRIEADDAMIQVMGTLARLDGPEIEKKEVTPVKMIQRDFYIETIHDVYSLPFVVEPHVEVDLTSTTRGIRLRETVPFTLAEWNSAKANGYYTKEMSEWKYGRLLAAAQEEPLDRVANEGGTW